MAVTSMDGVLTTLAAQAKSLQSPRMMPAPQQENGAGSFSTILTSSLNNISQLQADGKQQAASLLMGSSEVGLNDVMVSLQKSSVALNLGVQARNKLVSAYQEIMNMAV